MSNFLELIQPLNLRSYFSIWIVLIICACIALNIIQARYKGKHKKLICQIAQLISVGIIASYCVAFLPDQHNMMKLLELLREHTLFSLTTVICVNLVLDAQVCGTDKNENSLYNSALFAIITWLGGASITYFITQELWIYLAYLVLNLWIICLMCESDSNDNNAQSQEDKTEKKEKDEAEAKEGDVEAEEPTERLNYDQLINDLKRDPDGKEILKDLR